jgi:hypothetical protein
VALSLTTWRVSLAARNYSQQRRAGHNNAGVRTCSVHSATTGAGGMRYRLTQRKRSVLVATPAVPAARHPSS